MVHEMHKPGILDSWIWVLHCALLHGSCGKTSEPMPAYVLKLNQDLDSIHTKLLSNAVPIVDCAYEEVDERKLIVFVDKVSM